MLQAVQIRRKAIMWPVGRLQSSHNL